MVQPISHDPYPTGTIRLERLDMNQDGFADTPDILVVRGISTGNIGAVDWSNVYSFFGTVGQIRIPATTGQWYTFTVATSGPYAIGPSNQCLILQTPYSNTSGAIVSPAVIAYPFTGTAPAPVGGCDIQFGNEVLPFHQPIPLPSATVLDLRYSSSNVQILAGANIINTTGLLAPNIDISFSPRGSIAGATGGQGALYFCLRDLADAMSTSTNPLTAGGPRDPSDPACQGECLILALNPATGLVQTYPANLTDAFINSSGPNTATTTTGQDGYVDNLFSFAQQGKAAGR
ncbi:MAG TPA: hypothetical protein VGM05_19685 [Planctomycetaceae bacterium]